MVGHPSPSLQNGNSFGPGILTGRAQLLQKILAAGSAWEDDPTWTTNHSVKAVNIADDTVVVGSVRSVPVIK